MLCLVFLRYLKKKKRKPSDCVIFRNEKEKCGGEVEILILGKDKLLSQEFHFFNLKPSRQSLGAITYSLPEI